MFLFKLLRRAFSIVGLLIIIIPIFISYQIWNTGNSAKAVKSDVIVVLGAAQFNGRPTPVLQGRIDEAFRIYKFGYSKRIITVGAGAPGDRTTEAMSSYLSLVSKKVPKNRLTDIPIGRDTLTSTAAYVAVMKAHTWTSVIIVTDPLHCYRAVSMAQDLGVSATCSPAKSLVPIFSVSGIKYLVRETGAYLAYKTTNRIGIHLSDHLTK